MLVGIADLIDSRSIKIIFSNAHPTSIPIPDSRFPFPSWEGLGVGSDSRFPYLKPKTPIAGVSLTESNLSKKSQSGQGSGEYLTVPGNRDR
ncbi:MAG: hypothetical protein F6K65_25560 [Moorea sp. SIO3C2]|nr:hypothetical protein [Moorena sp. SIO3C2]